MNDRPTNQPTEGITKDGDMLEAQVHVPCFVQPVLRLTASLALITDILNYNRGTKRNPF